MSDVNEAGREAALRMILSAETIITAAVQASQMIFEKHGPEHEPPQFERVATLAKFIFMAASETSDDPDFQGVVAALALDELIQLKLVAK